MSLYELYASVWDSYVSVYDPYVVVYDSHVLGAYDSQQLVGFDVRTRAIGAILPRIRRRIMIRTRPLLRFTHVCMIRTSCLPF